MKLNRYLLGSTLVAALGGFLFGFDTAVISGTTESLEKVFHLKEQWLRLPGSFWLGFTVASALVGTIVGSIAAGKPSEVLGRKSVLMWLAVLYFVSAVGCGLAWSWTALVAFRFIGGLAIGGASVVSPMYIAEISPPHLRGRLVAVSQLNIVLGVLTAYFSNLVIAWLTTGPSTAEINTAAWRWMLGVVAVPSALFLVCLLPIPESPRWLVKRHRRDEALRVLKRLGNEDADRVLGEIVESLHEETVSADEPFFQPKYRKPILLAVAIAAFNQLSGINVVVYYTAAIFRMAGSESQAALLQAVAVGGTNLVFTLAAMAIIDHFGRRKLMLVGSIGYIFSLAATAWAFYTYSDAFKAVMEAAKNGVDVPGATALSAATGSMVVLASILLFIAAHAFGQGAVIWVFISEIFPNRVRARGQALGSFTHWVMAAVISWSFPMIAEQAGGHAFAFYAAMMVLQFVWVILIMPETKGVSLEQIQRKLGIE